MSDGVLPSLSVLLIVREALHDEPIDSVQGHFAIGRASDRHRNQSDVRVGRLLGRRQRRGDDVTTTTVMERTGDSGVVGDDGGGR